MKTPFRETYTKSSGLVEGETIRNSGRTVPSRSISRLTWSRCSVADVVEVERRTESMSQRRGRIRGVGSQISHQKLGKVRRGQVWSS